MAYAPEYAAENIPIYEIVVVGNRRPLNEAAVEEMRKSIFGDGSRKGVGLKTPIVVRGGEHFPDPETGEMNFNAWELVSGHHRLEAYKRQGEEYIPAIIRDWNETEAELWEISENLHCANLTAEQRREAIRRYADLLLIRDGENVEAKLASLLVSLLPDEKLEEVQDMLPEVSPGKLLSEIGKLLAQRMS